MKSVYVPSVAKKENAERIYSLDALKWIASILIVFHHFQQSTGARFSGINFFGGRFYFGYLVELYFILSGFWLGKRLEADSETTFVLFMKKKTVRLYPMASIATACYIILAWAYKFIIGEWYSWTPIGLWKAVASLMMIFSGGGLDFEDIGYGANNALWYICVLLLCYVWYWCVLHICKRLKVNAIAGCAVLMFIGMASVSYGLNLPYLNAFSGRGYMCFFWGVILYNILDKLKWYTKKIEWVIWLLLIGCIALLLLSKGVLLDDPKVLVFIIYPAVITLLLTSKLLKMLFNHKVFGELAGISFEIYIWHGVWLLLLAFIEKRVGRQLGYSYMQMFAFAMIVFLWSMALYYLAEKKIHKWICNYKRGTVDDTI